MKRIPNRLAFLTLSYLHSRADSGKVIASRKEIATALGVSGVSARNAIRTLERLGAVTVTPNVSLNGKTIANTFLLTRGE
jgi:Mn-dependent DtxR family transcriptional regulator